MAEAPPKELNEYDLVKNENIALAHITAFKHRRVSLVGSNQYKD